MEKTRIPKVIHYCWFGGGEKSKNVKKCIESWKKFCPDFEIIEWNESNYDVFKHPFMSQAYYDKKWAFVSDYARLDILFSHGGIYLDTDVELIKDISFLCENEAYIGFETDDKVNDGQGFGGVAGFPLFKEMMDMYDTLNEYMESPILRTEVLIKYGLEITGKRQQIKGMEIYPSYYFCPKSFRTGRATITSDTVSIHHYDASWKSPKAMKYIYLTRVLCRAFGEEKGYTLMTKVTKFKDRIRHRI